MSSQKTNLNLHSGRYRSTYKRVKSFNDFKSNNFKKFLLHKLAYLEYVTFKVVNYRNCTNVLICSLQNKKYYAYIRFKKKNIKFKNKSFLRKKKIILLPNSLKNFKLINVRLLLLKNLLYKFFNINSKFFFLDYKIYFLFGKKYKFFLNKKAIITMKKYKLPVDKISYKIPHKSCLNYKIGGKWKSKTDRLIALNLKYRFLAMGEDNSLNLKDLKLKKSLEAMYFYYKKGKKSHIREVIRSNRERDLRLEQLDRFKYSFSNIAKDFPVKTYFAAKLTNLGVNGKKNFVKKKFNKNKKARKKPFFKNKPAVIFKTMFFFNTFFKNLYIPRFYWGLGKLNINWFLKNILLGSITKNIHLIAKSIAFLFFKVRNHWLVFRFLEFLFQSGFIISLNLEGLVLRIKGKFLKRFGSKKVRASIRSLKLNNKSFSLYSYHPKVEYSFALAKTYVGVFGIHLWFKYL